MDLKTVKFELYNAGLSNAWPAIVMLLQFTSYLFRLQIGREVDIIP